MKLKDNLVLIEKNDARITSVVEEFQEALFKQRNQSIEYNEKIDQRLTLLSSENMRLLENYDQIHRNVQLASRMESEKIMKLLSNDTQKLNDMEMAVRKIEVI